MADHPAFVSITKTLIRINATAVKELLPEEVTPETHAMVFELGDDCERLEIGFVECDSEGSQVYSMNVKSGGYHTGSGSVRGKILDEQGVGRYECDWDEEKERLVVDLTEEAMEPQSRFELNLR